MYSLIFQNGQRQEMYEVRFAETVEIRNKEIFDLNAYPFLESSDHMEVPYYVKVLTSLGLVLEFICSNLFTKRQSRNV